MITVVTPWFDHRELEADYWAAMRAVDAKVLVIDNGSNPPLPNGIRLETNRGFSHACNVGLEHARTPKVLFLNNDVQASAGGWLTPIEAAVEPGVLVGADLRYNGNGDVDGHSLPYLDGWCLAGMREDLLDIGGWDESYDEPSYYGDNDLCFRARLAGMTLREVKVPLIHKTNATAGAADRPEVRSATLANRKRYENLVREALAVTV